MRFYNGGEQSFFTGKVAVKGSCGHSGMFYNLTQRSPKEALFGKLIQGGLLYFF